MTIQLKLTDSEKIQLLSLSRETLGLCFENPEIQNRRFGKNRAYYECEGKIIAKYSVLNIPVLREILSCFVTLYKLKDGSRKLRGCIGTIEARNRETLIENLINNTVLAAFGDSRFEPLDETELETTQIEISILSKPEPISFDTADELFDQIKGKGVVLRSGFYKATFLPQVWEQIKNPGDFLIHLARKAGMSSGDYLNASYEIYEVLAFEEERFEL